MALGQGLAVLGAIVGVRLLTALLPPASYGELSLAVSVAMVAHYLFVSPLTATCQRFYPPAVEHGRVEAFLRVTLQLLVQAAALLAAATLVVAILLWLAGRAMQIELLVAAMFFSCLAGLNGVIDAIQNAARRRPLVALHQAAAQWCRFLVAGGLILLWQATSTTAMWGYAFACALVLLSQGFFLRRTLAGSMYGPPAAAGAQAVGPFRHRTRSDHGNHGIQLRAYILPLSAAGALAWGQMAAERWALQSFDSTSNVGLYAVLYQLGYYPMVLLNELMLRLAEPFLFSRAGDGSDRLRLQASRRLGLSVLALALAATALTTTAAALAHRFIFSWLVAEEYRHASWLLPLVVLAGGLIAAANAAGLAHLAGTSSRGLLAPKAGSAALGCALSFCGACWWGLEGVVIAGLLFAAIYLASVLWSARVHFGDAR
jgi:O-antigen/teichoic acid export membrane protein